MLTCAPLFVRAHEGFPLCQKQSERIRIVIKTAWRDVCTALFELLDASPLNQPVRLNGLGQAIKDSVALRHVVASPAFALKSKLPSSQNSFAPGCPPVGRTFLAQLVKKNRVGFLPEIAEAFAKLADAAKGTQQITVSSAAAIPPAEQKRIITCLHEMLKHQIDVTFHTDARHLAGVQIHLGSTVVDSTVRGRLQAMQSLLTKE